MKNWSVFARMALVKIRSAVNGLLDFAVDAIDTLTGESAFRESLSREEKIEAISAFYKTEFGVVAKQEDFALMDDETVDDTYAQAMSFIATNAGGMV